MILFLISLVEALVLVGYLIPGGVIVAFAGFLSSTGQMNFWYSIFFSALGAIVGDCISFWLGTHGENFFEGEKRLLKEKHIDYGKKFFHRFGPKSIILGRFGVVLRGIIPFIAGLAGMNRLEFFFWNVLSGFVWATPHVVFGYFVANSLSMIEVWTVRAEFIFLASFVLIAGYFIFRKRKEILGYFGK
jgi:undecaprenyl-diphosphatase